jgi:hypothetical protein
MTDDYFGSNNTVAYLVGCTWTTISFVLVLFVFAFLPVAFAGVAPARGKF